MKDRPEWDDTFMAIAQIWSERATCSRRKVGAVVVKDQKVIGQGYNGVASGKPHCIDGGCPRGQMGPEVPPGADYNQFPCYAIHAEHNAILQAGLQSCRGATIYVTSDVCQQCLNLIEHAGIERIVIMGHERGEDQDTTEEKSDHDTPHPSSIEEDE